MTRFTKAAEEAGQQVYEFLGALTDQKTAPPAYRDAMVGLGKLLGEKLCRDHHVSGTNVCIAFTAEAADFLATGAVDAISEAGAQITVACFWNRRDRPFDVDWLDVAPIIQEYVEPQPAHVEHLVVMKSIISGACVVRTNLLRLLEAITPSHIHVVAPVMLQGAEDRLAEFLPEDVVERFEYSTFAIDSEKTETGLVVPGIGGEVYERLGLGNHITKNEVMPRLVEARIYALT